MDGSVTTEEPSDLDGLFTKLKNWCLKDKEKSATWRKEAKEDFGFASGDGQWSETDKEALRDQLRPIITMNRVDPIIDSVSGSEVANRQEVRYIPREQGDVKVNEVLTSAAQWFRDQCDAEDEESDAFRDTLICGMGWTETRLDYEEEPDGAPVVERIDPIDMVWDGSCVKRNLKGARRLFHVRKLPIEEARALVQTDLEDADYNATWIDDLDNSEAKDGGPQFYDNDTKDDDSESLTNPKHVTLVRAQWWERAPVYRVVDPANPQNELTLDEDEFDDLKAKADKLGIQLRHVRQLKRVYKQAYIGKQILEVGPAPCKEHFSFNCITGKRARNSGSWYGLVRGMKDPQRWANKWLSQSLHILNTTAKGGIMAERGAFDNDADAEKSWAKQDAITWAKHGSIAAGRIKEKPQSALPTGFYQLLEFAISSIRDTSGVNVETLGMREAGQAASLEHMRKQSSMTILQPMFDSLRRYRKMQGRQLLYIIREFLSDGRLIRIVGKDQEQYVPLTKQEGSDKYDIIVDDAPSSPNQKEATWAMLQQILPVIGPMLPPKTWMALIEFSPLPTSAQQKIKDSIEPPKGPDGQPLPPPPDPEVVKAQQEMELEQRKAVAEQDRAKQKQEFELGLAHAKAEREAEIEAFKARSQIALQREKAMADQEIAQQRAADDANLKHQQSQRDEQHQQRKFEIDVDMKRRQMSESAEKERAVEAPVMAELQRLAEMVAATHKIAAAPRRSKLIRGKDGKPSEAVSTVEL